MTRFWLTVMVGTLAFVLAMLFAPVGATPPSSEEDYDDIISVTDEDYEGVIDLITASIDPDDDTIPLDCVRSYTNPEDIKELFYLFGPVVTDGAEKVYSLFGAGADRVNSCVLERRITSDGVFEEVSFGVDVIMRGDEEGGDWDTFSVNGAPGSEAFHGNVEFRLNFSLQEMLRSTLSAFFLDEVGDDFQPPAYGSYYEITTVWNMEVHNTFREYIDSTREDSEPVIVGKDVRCFIPGSVVVATMQEEPSPFGGSLMFFGMQVELFVDWLVSDLSASVVEADVEKGRTMVLSEEEVDDDHIVSLVHMTDLFRYIDLWVDIDITSKSLQDFSCVPESDYALHP